MPVPSSGQLRLRADINQEINGNNTDDNVSLGTLSNDAGFSEPDTMSEFYGYSSCGTPAFRTTYSSANPNGQIMLYTILDYTPYCNTTEYGLYVGTNSSGPTANTKYVVASGSSVWGVYQWKYPAVTGFSNNTTYYAWIYATNSAGKTGYSSMQTVTVPPPYVPLNSYSYNATGDWSGANYCPNYNFIGGYYVYFQNTTSTTYFDIYGDSNFYHASSQTYGCPKTYGAWPASSDQRQFTAALNYTCYDYSTCGTTRSITGKFRSSGYSDVIFSTSRACNPC